jgi:acyl CoA:acetate/3-ketoacid CoA transferase beta subunit
MIVTELAVFKVDSCGLTLIEYNKESSISEIREKTGTDFKISPNLCFMS